MKRRTALKLLSVSSVGLAGCIANGAVNSDSNDSQSNTQSPPTKETNTTIEKSDATMDISKSIEIVNTNSAPSSFGISFTIKPVIETITPKHTPQVEVTMENETNHKLKLNSGSLTQTSTNSNGAGLLIVEGDTIQAPDCSHYEASISPDSVTQTFSSNEKSSTIYTLKNDPSSNGCFETGTYRFSNTYTKSGSGNRRAFKWYFSIKVKKTHQ